MFNKLLFFVLSLDLILLGCGSAGLGGTQEIQSLSLPALGDDESTDNASAISSVGSMALSASVEGTISSSSETAAFSMQAPPSNSQDTLMQFDTTDATTSQVYMDGTYYNWQSLSTHFTESPLFWVNTRYGWSWQASCPIGGWVQELLYLPRTGNVAIYEIYPSGLVQKYDFGRALGGYHYIWFDGDIQGIHSTFLTSNGVASNFVTIRVVPYSMISSGQGTSTQFQFTSPDQMTYSRDLSTGQNDVLTTVPGEVVA